MEVSLDEQNTEYKILRWTIVISAFSLLAFLKQNVKKHIKPECYMLYRDVKQVFHITRK